MHQSFVTMSPPPQPPGDSGENVPGFYFWIVPAVLNKCAVLRIMMLLFPETCPYSVYRKDINIHGGGVMLLVHKDISHMPITELENDLESIWVKVFANKTSHFVASRYRPPGSTSEEFKLFRERQRLFTRLPAQKDHYSPGCRANKDHNLPGCRVNKGMFARPPGE